MPPSKPTPTRSAAPKPLTTAQERVLLDALRAHPAPLRAPNARVASALNAAGLFQPAAAEGEAAFVLTVQGIDTAARLSAQQVIDAVDRRRSQSPHAVLPRPGDPPPANGKPANWPFPESAHAW